MKVQREAAMATQIARIGGAVSVEIPADLLQKEIAAGFAEITARQCVSGEKVLAWLQSWGTEGELLRPL